jgi:hypothetical protein
MNEHQHEPHHHEHEKGHHHNHNLVVVTIDGKPKHIERGEYVVSELKKLLDVDASRALDEVIHGEFKPLDDSERIHIKGGEVFVSHVRDGGSS